MAPANEQFNSIGIMTMNILSIFIKSRNYTYLETQQIKKFS